MDSPAPTQSAGLPLVAGRGCGDCHVCCYALRIDEPTMHKPAGAICKFLDSHGCSIYENRFPTCRSWLCGWRFQSELDESWRPDLSGVLLVPDTFAELGYRPTGYKVQLASHAPLVSPDVLNKLCGFIAGDTPLYLSLEGHPTKVFLNRVLAPLITAGNGQAIMTTLAQMLRKLTAPAR